MKEAALSPNNAIRLPLYYCFMGQAARRIGRKLKKFEGLGGISEGDCSVLPDFSAKCEQQRLSRHLAGGVCTNFL
ncbi:MAG: hypothetical protein KJ717_08410, partial [Proteobacteria bacterium]|nr:hypothetical protein [Pseudomonadota bacterium]